jgi:hypothetical protein
MQKKHKLREVSMEDLANWPFADATFGVEFDNINNVTKLRQVPQHCVVASLLDRQTQNLETCRALLFPAVFGVSCAFHTHSQCWGSDNSGSPGHVLRL